MKRRLLLLTGLVVVLIVVFVTTGTSLIPARLLLGPCFRDWTSPSSYGTRSSPLATVDARVGDRTVRLCYGRPSMRGRQVYGGLVPWGELWRFGANEPTRLYTGHSIRVAGITLAPGRYSLYVIPNPDHWELFVSRSVLHWGLDISPAVRAKEVGSAVLTPDSLPAPVETFSIHAAPAGSGSLLQVDWETTRITIPVEAVP